jgi:hypothetical protein
MNALPASESLHGECTCKSVEDCCAADLTTLCGSIVKCQMRIRTGERGGVQLVGELQHREQDHPASLSQHANGHIPVGILKLLHLSHRSSPTTANVSAAGVGRAGLALRLAIFSPTRGEFVSVYRSRRIYLDQTRRATLLFADIRQQYDRVLAPCPHILCGR